jgi:phosphatidylglycerol:prolipoprotein diacylglycerol transferase
VFPQLFHVGSFWLPTYGLLVAIGVLSGLTVAAKLAERAGVASDTAWNLGVLAIISSIVGAKLMLFINDWSWYAAHPGEIFSLSTLQAGGVFYGGLIAAVALSLWYIRKHRLPVLATCDAFAPGIALGHAIGRLGCFAAGCCYGKPTSLPWGVTFTNPLANHISGTPLGVPLHPTELYEAIFEFLNFLFLYWLFKRKTSDGQVLGAYMFLYGVARFFVEFVRGDPERGSVFGGVMTGTQLISIFLVLIGGALWLRRKKLPETAVARASH